MDDEKYSTPVTGFEVNYYLGVCLFASGFGVLIVQTIILVLSLFTFFGFWNVLSEIKSSWTIEEFFFNELFQQLVSFFLGNLMITFGAMSLIISSHPKDYLNGKTEKNSKFTKSKTMLIRAYFNIVILFFLFLFFFQKVVLGRNFIIILSITVFSIFVFILSLRKLNKNKARFGFIEEK